jgi:hypothetical protein
MVTACYKGNQASKRSLFYKKAPQKIFDDWCLWHHQSLADVGARHSVQSPASPPIPVMAAKAAIHACLASAVPTPLHPGQKFFASFLQKRSACFSFLPGYGLGAWTASRFSLISENNSAPARRR